MGYDASMRLIWGINVRPYLRHGFDDEKQEVTWWLENEQVEAYRGVKVQLFMDEDSQEWLCATEYDASDCEEDDDETFNAKHAQVNVLRDAYTGEVTSAAFVLGNSSPQLSANPAVLNATFAASEFALGEADATLLADARATLAKIGLDQLSVGVVVLYAHD